MAYLENFHTQVLGNPGGPKLIFLHGLMGSGANWRKITPAFEKDYHILLLDQRGHGRSFHPEFGFSPEDYARDLHKILEELGWGEEAILLVGHSMGGRNALAFAHLYPQRVAKLVIEDIGPDSHPDAVKQIEFYLDQVPTPFADKRAAKQFFDEEFPRRIGSGPKSQVLAQYFYTNIATREDGRADWRFSPKAILSSVREGRAYERWDQIRALKGPTLVIRGSRSEELSEEVFHRMVAANPLITGVQIPESGHWVHFDQPQAFIEALTQFFANR